MSDFRRRVPKNLGELKESLQALYTHKDHIQSVKFNESNSHIEVDLDRAANMFGGESGKDFYIPIKSGKLREAKMLVDKLLGGVAAPSETDATVLFDMINPQGL